MSYGQNINFIGASGRESFPLIGSGGINGENKVNLLAIGDSRTTQNHGGAWPFAYRFNMGAVCVAMSFVRDMYRWQNEFNLGINGDVSQGIDVRKNTDIPAVLAMRPSYEEWDAVYWCAVNDMFAGVSQAGYSTYFKSTMKYMMNLGFRNIFVLSEVPYPNGYGGESSGTHATRIALAKQYNEVMKDFCDQNENLHYVDNYGLYGSSSDPDVSNPTYNDGSDIHPGSIGATIVGRSLANSMIRARGIPALISGKTISANPSLIDVENIIQSGTQNNFYCSAKTAGVVTERAVGDNALVVTIDATDGTGRNFNIFNNTTTVADVLMPGDLVQACLDIEILAATGQPAPPYAYIQENGGTNFSHANNNPAGYGKGVVLGLGRQVFMSDPFLMAAGKAGKVMNPYLVSGAVANTMIKFAIYELSCRRVYTSPNAEYSAAASIPLHRKNIKCMTSTASAAFTLTLPKLYDTEDGHVVKIQDYEGAAATNNVTVAGNGSELIKDGASSGNTVVLSTNYFNKEYRADRGAGAWLAQ
jgi:hypothetical protein